MARFRRIPGKEMALIRHPANLLSGILLVATLVLTVPLSAAQPPPDDASFWLPTARLINPNDPPVMSGQFCLLGTNPMCGPAQSDFGASLAVDAGHAVVSHPHAGLVHFYARGTATWLPANTVSGPPSFGNQVAMSGSIAAVSAPEARQVHLFAQSDGEWTSTHVLSRDNGACFGSDIDVNAGLLVVADRCASRIHVYDVIDPAIPLAALELPGVAELGRSVAISDGVIVAASSNGAYVFEAAASGWSALKFAASGAGLVDISGTIIALSTGSGVRVYEREVTSWRQTAHLYSRDASPFTEFSYFGWSIALEGSTLVVGAFEDDPLPGEPAVPESEELDCVSQAGVRTCIPPRPGAAYVFENGKSEWAQSSKLVGEAVGDHRFGAAVAIDSQRQTILVGAPSRWHGNVGGILDVDPADTAHVFVRGGA